MSTISLRSGLFSSFLFVCLLFNRATAQRLRLQVTGDVKTGYRVMIYNGDRPLIANTEECSIQLYNTDYSTRTDLPSWTGARWTGDDNQITLNRDSYIPAFDANLSVQVRYEIVNSNTIRKTIQLFQPCMPDMYYILKETTRPAEQPLRYVTFEHDSFPGGLVHEMYPSAGWITPGGQLIGVLTDAGYRNQYTRTTRRRWSGRGGGFTGMRKLPDPELYSIATPAEQRQHNHFVRQTFGEYYNLDAGAITTLQPGTIYRKAGNVSVRQDDSILQLLCNAAGLAGSANRAGANNGSDAGVNGPEATAGANRSAGPAGVEWIAPLHDQQAYTLSFFCKGNTPLSLKLFRIRNGKKTIELEDGLKYIDNFPTEEGQWTRFKGSILIPYIGHDSISLFIGTQSGQPATLEIKDLQIQVHQPQREPYNLLPIGRKQEKTTYIFTEPWKSHKDFMISSQTRLAEGKGFQGSAIEKMLYANFNMLTWVTSIADPTPFNVPNMNYSPDMYNRDSYFSAVSTYNKEVNLSLWEQWGRTQTPSGGIGTIITPYMGSVEAKDNEATIEWLMWALLNKRRFHANLPQDKIKKAADYVLREFDSAHDGKCRSHFPMSQVDIIDYNPPTDRLAVNQGMLAIALRTIKELGFDIPETYIQKTEQEYRNFYDTRRRHLLFDRNYPDLISLTDLEPEFFSLWLFNRPLLTDEMVINHLEQIPVLNKVRDSPHPEFGTTAPICVRLTRDKKGFAYLSGDYQPFEKFGQDNYSDGRNDGYYYNGGSWMRAEYCAYVVGLKHGWRKAMPLMENRAWAEINLNPKWPFSKEFIPTKWTSTDSWWESTRGLCWNVFILMADEVAGLRKPEMDPDFQPAVNDNHP